MAAVHAQNASTNLATNTAAATNQAGASNVAATAATTAGATRAAAARTTGGDNDWLSWAIWGAIIAAIFFFLWTKGYLIKIRNYVDETREELRKCSWPSREELKGSTVVVLVTTAMLGIFTVGVDWVLSNILALIT